MNLKEIRTQKGYTQLQVAEYLNITKQGYSHYERGTRTPDIETLKKLAKFFDVSINALLNIKEEQKEKASDDISEAIEEVPDWRGIAFALHSTKGQLSEEDVEEVAKFIAFRASQKKEKK